MGKPRGPRRSVTAADKAAAKRLHALWKAIPKDQRPSQEELGSRFPGETGSQSLISQYMLGRIALNYRAVRFFATALNVPESAIRTDLPEQNLNQSPGDQNSPGDVSSGSHSAGISLPILDQAFEMFCHDEEQAGKYATHLERVERLGELYRRIEAEGGQLSKAGILRIGEEIERRRGRDERPGVSGERKQHGKRKH